MGERRILVIGCSGAGKSTLAQGVAERLALPLIHLDAVYWLPEWQQPQRPDWRSKVAALAAQDAWVMDGNYAGTFDLRMPRPHFADFPRTELRFYGSLTANETDPPKLVVFYLGVPDTTPEFASEAALETYLADRIARVRANTGSKAP